jgi:serine/threonine-protein kinase ATR
VPVIIDIRCANDIQLALCLWTSPDAWPDQVAVVRRELCSSDWGGFTAQHLLEESAPLLKAFRTVNLNDENSRPAKRRKTLPELSEDVNRTTYERLTMILNGNLQESPVLNLASLHNVVQ